MKTRAYLFLAILAVTALGCQLFTDLFNPQEEPVTVQNEDPVAPPDDTNENEQNEGGALDGAGPQEEMRELIPLDHGGITIFYDPQVILDIVPETISAGPGEFQLPYPSYTRYNLSMDYGYIELVDTFIIKYEHPLQAEKLGELENLLSAQSTRGYDCIPGLQLEKRNYICSHQQFNASLEFVDFENGSGVRFVTVYAIQDAVPVSNEGLVYVFQGVTTNRECYLRAHFKISHDALPESGEIPMDVWSDSSGILLDEYFGGFQALMESDPDGYFPSLEYLDRIIESIAVGVCAIG